ncbi:hypothetical protein MCEMSE15_03081 [Fimbriimonadaceae bacterium]
MVDAGVKVSVLSATAGAPLRAILRQNIQPPAISAAGSKSERYVRFVERYLEIKRPGIELAQDAALEVDDLPGTTDIVVAGPKEAMLDLIAKVENDEQISVVLDREISLP